jgi:F420H(2)-dependent quinone reductase
MRERARSTRRELVGADYLSSPNAFVAAQVEEYESTDGKRGADLEGKPCIVLWTTGRRTGALRKSPLMRVEGDGSYVVVASAGGSPRHPAWYLNLLADPRVRLQDGTDCHEFMARALDGEERDYWWRIATAQFAAFDDYQSQTEREIPIILLTCR